MGALVLEEPVSAKGTLGWTTGFFPGSLWYIYEYLKKHGTEAEAKEMLGMARTFTAKLNPVQHLTNDHDVGFVMYCSYGTGLQITGDESYKPVLLQTASSLLSRLNPNAGVTKSWDWWGDKKKDLPVIMDNMMNLELLYWAARESGNQSFKEAADSHASQPEESRLDRGQQRIGFTFTSALLSKVMIMLGSSILRELAAVLRS